MQLRRAARVVATIVVTAGSFAVIASDAPSNAATGRTLLSFVSASGDPIGAGASKTFTPADGTFSFTGTSTHVGLMFHTPTYSEWWDLDIAAGAGDVLRPGVFVSAERYPFQTGRAPGLAFAGDGRGCNRDYGQFAVNQIAFDSSGNLTLLDATFTQHCESKGAPALTGTVLYNASPLTYSFQSDAGDYIGQGLSQHYVNSTSLMQMAAATDGFQYTVSGLGDNWMAMIDAPTGAKLRAGTTYPATRFGDATHARLDVGGDGRGCNASSGTVTVNGIRRDGTGTIVAIWLTFVQHCENGTPALHGTIHYFA